MIVPIIAVTLAQLGSSTPVSVTINSCPVPDAVSQLAQITHLPLKATKAADYGSLMVCVHDYPTDKLLQRVANDLGARWEQEGSILYLKPDEAKLKAIEALGLQQRIKVWKREITAAASAGATGLSSQNKGTESYQASQRTIAKILASFPADQILSVGPGNRVVYALNPTAMQKPYPDTAAALVRTAMKEHPSFQQSPDPKFTTPPPTTALLALTNGDLLGGMFNGQLMMFDQHGNLANSLYYFSGDGMNKPTAQPPSSNPDDNKPIEVDESPFTKLVSNAMALQNQSLSDPSGAADKMNSLVDGFSKLMSDPVTNEPTRVVSDYAIALAKHEGSQLVGWVPDSSVFKSFTQAPASKTPYAIRTTLLSGSDLLVQKNEADEDVTPTDPEVEKSDYVSRSDLKSALGFYKSIDHLGLKTYLEMGNYFKGRAIPGLVQASLLMTSMKSAATLFSVNWDLIHLLDSLDSEDLSKLFTGGSISSTNFTAQQQAMLHNYVYGSQQPQILSDSESNSENASPQGNFGPLMVTSLSSEITVALPDGVPGSIRITFSPKTMPGFRAYHDPSKKQNFVDMMTMPGSLKELADNYYFMSSAEAQAKFPGMPDKMEALEIGSLTTYTIDLHLKDNMIARSQFTDYDFSGSPHYQIGHLPPQYQKEWDDEIAARKKAGDSNDAVPTTPG